MHSTEWWPDDTALCQKMSQVKLLCQILLHQHSGWLNATVQLYVKDELCFTQHVVVNVVQSGWCICCRLPWWHTTQAQTSLCSAPNVCQGQCCVSAPPISQVRLKGRQFSVTEALEVLSCFFHHCLCETAVIIWMTTRGPCQHTTYQWGRSQFAGY